MGKEGVKIEIMDTTLRDGEQTSGVSFVPHEKLMIARLLLEDLKVDRVEVASARVSDGEFEAVKMICDWAARRNLLHKVEVLGFVDGHTSVDWIQRTGCRVINLLCKGSLKHCTQQLKKTPEEHLADIINVVHYADEQDITVNVYLEDWSNGIKDSPEYVFQLMDGLRETSVKRYMLPDTLGILNPLQVIEYMRKMKKRYPNTHLDFHAHNDYDLAVSNVLAAVLSGVKGLHTTINGLGERAGNAPLASVQAILKDHFNAATNIDESRLNDVSRVVESYSGIMIPANKPIVGTETARESKKVPVFVPVSYSNGEKKIIGSTVLFPSTISEMTQYVVKNDCRYLETKTEAVNGIDMLFCSVSLNSEDLIAPAVDVFKKKVNEQTVLVGTVKRALLPNLESAITSNLTSDTYSFVEVENRNRDSEYCIFVLTSHKWAFRGVTETSVSGDLHCFQLQIESLK